MTEASRAGGGRFTVGAATVALDDVDTRRVRQVADFVRSHTAAELVAEILPGTAPPEVAATLGRDCRVAYGSVMVFPAAGPERLADGPAPSAVVRGRVAHRYGFAAADLPIQTLRDEAGDVEVLLCPARPGDRYERMRDDERRAGHETHFALTVVAPECERVTRLWDLLTGPGRLAPYGGEFDPCAGLIGRTTLHFQTGGQILPQGWPRRLTLLIDGRHEVLAAHLAATRSPVPAAQQQAPGPVPDRDEEPTRRMFELLTGAWTTQALCAAAELRLADHLAAGPATSAELAGLAGADADLLHRLLRYLATMGVVRLDGGRWELTDLGRTLRTGALRDVARLYGGLFYRSFGSLAHSVRTGENAFEHAFGMAPFDYLNRHPEQARIFHGAMAAGSSWFSQVPEIINFAGARTVVDIAGGHGDLLRHVLTASPATRGVLFDQPAVVDAARKALADAGLADRCEVVGGDFTEQVPPGGDLYLLSRVLHDWDDERCVRILATCRRAMPETALLVIIERPIPTDGTPSLAIAWDVHMSVNNLGGRERTREEYRRLLHAAGFCLVDARPLALDMAALTAAPYPAASEE